MDEKSTLEAGGETRDLLLKYRWVGREGNQEGDNGGLGLPRALALRELTKTQTGVNTASKRGTRGEQAIQNRKQQKSIKRNHARKQKLKGQYNTPEATA